VTGIVIRLFDKQMVPNFILMGKYVEWVSRVVDHLMMFCFIVHPSGLGRSQARDAEGRGFKVGPFGGASVGAWASFA
jgi:hypothetical protein